MGNPNDIVQSTLYDGITNANSYDMMPGVCILPLAEDPPTDLESLAEYSPVVIARLHAPYRIRKYNFSEHKQNNPPVIQTPEDTGAFVFVGGSLSFYTQFNSTWWNSDWTVDGSYIYIENCVSRPQDGFVLGSVTPFTNDPDASATSYYTGDSEQPQITIGAIAFAGDNAQAGFIYGQYIAGLYQGSLPTEIDGNGGTPISGGSGGTGTNLGGTSPGDSPYPLGLITSWNYTMTSFYPGTLLNNELANAGGV